MANSYASNPAAGKAIVNLNRTTSQLSDTFERLSSGLRIVDASDDPAGLAVADSLRSSARVAAVAIRNANDGLSLSQVADAALEEVNHVLERMSELANQSINGSFTQVQRSALAIEFVALGSEIDRIAATTKFNNINVLSASQNMSIQVGLDGSSRSTILVQSVVGTLSALGLAPFNASNLTYSIIAVTTTASQSAAQNALNAVTGAIGSVTAIRGTLGAAESRLSTAINYLSTARENFELAESRIRDVDVALEVANMVRLQILQQAGTAVLAQANQQPGIVLSLLQ